MLLPAPDAYRRRATNVVAHASLINNLDALVWHLSVKPCEHVTVATLRHAVAPFRPMASVAVACQ